MSPVRGLHRDTLGATVLADSCVCIERHLHFVGRCTFLPLLQLGLGYVSNATGVSSWTVEPAFGGRPYFTITAQMALPGPLGVLLRPVPWRLFNQLNVAPFLHAARARSSASAVKGPVS